MNTDKIYAEQIVNEYAPKKTSKAVALKKLDRKAKTPAMVFAYTFGIIAALVFGTGLCLAMKVIGNGTVSATALGIIVGLVGMALMAINYPIYVKILNNSKQKYYFEIMELAKEIGDED